MHMVQETVFGVVHQHQQLRFPKDDWPQSFPATAAPDPAGGRAWHICCVERCCRECDASVPGGSVCLSYALYSQAERNTQLPHPKCARQVPQLQERKNITNMNHDTNTVRWETNMTRKYQYVCVPVQHLLLKPSDSERPAAELCPCLSETREPKPTPTRPAPVQEPAQGSPTSAVKRDDQYQTLLVDNCTLSSSFRNNKHTGVLKKRSINSHFNEWFMFEYLCKCQV